MLAPLYKALDVPNPPIHHFTTTTMIVINNTFFCFVSGPYFLYQLNISIHLYTNGILSGCLCVWMYPRHGYSFKDTTVWSSPNDRFLPVLGVSALKISNLPKPEVEL